MKIKSTFPLSVSVALSTWLLAGATIHSANGASSPAPSTQSGVHTGVAAPGAPAAADPAAQFLFPGGNPQAFVRAVQVHFGVDWEGIASVPPDLESAQIPKIRITTRDPVDLLKLYNRLADADPALGRWHLEGDALKPAVLMLAPDRALKGFEWRKPSGPEVLRVLSIRGVPKEKWGELEEFLERARNEALRFSRSKAEMDELARGRMIIDPRAGALLAYGNENVQRMVQSIVEVFGKPRTVDLEVPIAVRDVQPGQTLNNPTPPTDR